MFQLHTLGGFSAHDASGASRTLPRHRWALVALVASVGDRGISRDKVLACLWPEVPGEKARARLQQMLHAIRASLDAQLFLPGDPLRLNSAVIASDVAEFHQAIDAGDLPRAGALYRGPFLDGFHLGDAPEFDEWLERERDLLRGRWASAIERLATDAGVRGDCAGAASWWHALVVADPLNSRLAHRLMEALVAAGDRTSALHFAAAHTAHVQEELGLEPDANMMAFASRIRHHAAPASDIARVAHPTEPTPIAEQVRAGTVADASLASTALLPTSSRAPPSQWNVHRRHWAIAAVVTSMAAAAVWAIALRSRAATVERRVAVVPFDNRTGDARLDAFGDLISDMVTEGLVRAGVTDVVPFFQTLRSFGAAGERSGDPARAVAAKTGASLIAYGAYHRSGDTVIVNASIVDGPSGRIVQPFTPIVGPADGLLALATTVRNRVVGTIAARLEPTIRRRPDPRGLRR